MQASTNEVSESGILWYHERKQRQPVASNFLQNLHKLNTSRLLKFLLFCQTPQCISSQSQLHLLFGVFLLQVCFLGGGFECGFIFTPKIGEDDEPILTSIFFRWVGSTTNQFLWSSGFLRFHPEDLNLNPPNLRRQTPAVASFASLPSWGEGKQWPEGDQGPERCETPCPKVLCMKAIKLWKPSFFVKHWWWIESFTFFLDLFSEIAVILVCTLCRSFGTLPWHVGMFLGSCHSAGTTSVMVRNIPNRHLAFSWCW